MRGAKARRVKPTGKASQKRSLAETQRRGERHDENRQHLRHPGGAKPRREKADGKSRSKAFSRRDAETRRKTRREQTTPPSSRGREAAKRRSDGKSRSKAFSRRDAEARRKTRREQTTPPSSRGREAAKRKADGKSRSKAFSRRDAEARRKTRREQTTPPSSRGRRSRNPGSPDGTQVAVCPLPAFPLRLCVSARERILVVGSGLSRKLDPEFRTLFSYPFLIAFLRPTASLRLSSRSPDGTQVAVCPLPAFPLRLCVSARERILVVGSGLSRKLDPEFRTLFSYPFLFAFLPPSRLCVYPLDLLTGPR